MVPDWLITINSIAWITANLLIAYIAVALLVFVILYVIIFDPKATTGGRLIFRFFVSLVGVMGLVFIGSFIDPVHGREWFVYPGDVIVWRPVVRLIVYGYVAFTVTSLVVLLIIRKWYPEKLRTVADQQLVKVRTHDHT